MTSAQLELARAIVARPLAGSAREQVHTAAMGRTFAQAMLDQHEADMQAFDLTSASLRASDETIAKLTVERDQARRIIADMKAGARALDRDIPIRGYDNPIIAFPTGKSRK